jgi:hypothetical protein
MVEKELVERLRTLQASLINKSKKNVSFSQIVNLAINEGIDKLNKKRYY